MKQEQLNTIKLAVLGAVLWTLVGSGWHSEPRSVAKAADASVAGDVVDDNPAANGDKVYWHDNYAAALKEAKATGKPIFLEFRCAP